MKVTVEHCEAGHIAEVEVTADTGAVVRFIVENAWAQDGHPPKAAIVELRINDRNAGVYTGVQDASGTTPRGEEPQRGETR